MKVKIRHSDEFEIVGLRVSEIARLYHEFGSEICSVRLEDGLYVVRCLEPSCRIVEYTVDASGAYSCSIVEEKEIRPPAVRRVTG